jgi:hypothetical protein
LPAVHGHNPATVLPKSRRNPIRQCTTGRIKQEQGWAMKLKDESEWLAREREEIAARVANFRATQKKFEREREEYYAATLASAWDGFNKPIFWN